jgi:hypothetical protein
MQEGVNIQDLLARLKAHVDRDAVVQAEEDAAFFSEQGINPTDGLLREVSQRRARLYGAKVEAELESRMGEGMSIEEAIADYLITLGDDLAALGDDLAALEDEEDQTRDIQTSEDDELNPRFTPDNRKEASMFQGFQRKFTKVHHKLGSSPLINWFLGGLSLLLWACASVVQIQTSEYLAQGGIKQVAGVAWGVITQPYLLITGQAPIEVATSWMYAWVVELITLVFALALSVAVTKIALANPKLGKWFILGGAVLILLNGWADYSSSPGNSPLVQFLIALAIGGIVVVGLPLGIGLLEHGFEEF